MDKRHQQKNFKENLEKIKSPINCPGVKWKLDYENGDGDFDKEIIPLLSKMNTAKWHTVASCAGHTLKDISTHNLAYMVQEPYRIIIYIHVAIKHMTDFMKMTEEMKFSTKGYFVCSLGSNQDDYSNHVEKGFLPFEIEVFSHTKQKRDGDLLILEKIANSYNS